MNKVSYALTFALRKLWQLIAITLVLVALLVSAVRYSVPYINDHTDKIESYVKQNYGIDLVFGNVSATWTSTGPSLVLEDVDMTQGADSPITLNVGDLYLVIDFWPSVTSLSLQSSNVRLSNLELVVDLSELEGGEGENLTVVQALETIFLEQLSNFAVDSSRIILRDKFGERTVNIEQLSWLNKEERHQGFGLFSLGGFSRNSASFIIDLYGNIDSYNGQFYAQGEQLDISPWINDYTPLQGELINSDGNFEVWAQINNTQISKIQGHILPSEFIWLDAEKGVNTKLEGRFAATPGNRGWRFDINGLNVTVDDESFQSQWSGRWLDNGNIYFENHEALELTPLRRLGYLVSQELGSQLETHRLTASVKKIQGLLHKDGPILRVRDAEISSVENGLVPGVDTLRFHSDIANGNAKVSIEQSSLSLSSQNLFDIDHTISEIKIDAYIHFQNQQFQNTSIQTAGILSIPTMQFDMSGLSIDGHAEYNFDTSYLSISTALGELPLNKIRHYLPNELMGAGTKAFLNRGFNGVGQVSSGHILWHGRAQDYPFAEQQGIFEANVNIEDGDLLFSEQWPALSQLDIELAFVDQGLIMTSPSSMLANVAITDLVAEIPRLGKNAILNIKATGEGSGSSLADLMMQSNLQDSLGNLLSNDIQISGPLTTELELIIPLVDDAEVTALGEVSLHDNDLYFNDLNLTLSRSTGVISFNNDKLAITDLRADLFELPVAIDMTSQQKEAYEVDLFVTGSWDSKTLANTYMASLENKVSGDVDWALDLDLLFTQGSFSYVADLTSDLVDFSNTLPQPLGKQKNVEKQLVLNAQGDDIASNIQLNIGQEVSFEGYLPHQEKRFNRAQLRIGQSDELRMGVGFSIYADLPELHVEEWYSLVSGVVSQVDANSNSKSYLPAPSRIFIDTQRLIFDDYVISDLGSEIRRREDSWSMDIDSDQIRGRALLYDDWFTKGLEVRADYVRLARREKQTGEGKLASDFDPKDLPKLSISCELCEFAGVNFGKIRLEAEPNNDGLEIKQFQVSDSKNMLTSSGQWYKRHQDHYTFITGKFNSDDFGEYLSLYDLESGIKDSEAQIDFTLSWLNSPMEFNFETLNGELDWQIGDGYLTEVSDKGSRIFSLLSLNSLVRKLSLDFRDVFAKGFFYDDMQGSIQITDGSADTRDTKIDGAAGEIEIYGYADLVEERLNYNVSFAPNVTGNLPVLFFFTVSPPSALAALAIDQVLTSAKVISNVNYSVTGTFDAPILIETGRQSTEVELPTRAISEPDADESGFVPPGEDDLININQDG